MRGETRVAASSKGQSYDYSVEEPAVIADRVLQWEYPLSFTDPSGLANEDSNNKHPMPTDSDGNPTPPPVPVAYGEEGATWKPVKGTPSRPVKWVPTIPVKIPGGKGSQPSGSWDPDGHFDIKPGDGGGVKHFSPDGKPLTPEEAHPFNKPNFQIGIGGTRPFRSDDSLGTGLLALGCYAAGVGIIRVIGPQQPSLMR